MPHDSRVCVTGIGLVTPIGTDLVSFWDSLLAGRSGAAEVRSFDTSKLANHVGCEIGAFDLPDRVRGRLLGGRCTELAAAAAVAATARAGIDGVHDRTPDLAVVVGTTMGDVTRFEHERASHPEHEATVEDVDALAGRPIDVMARSLAGLYGVTGHVLTVPAACAAGNYAIGLAASLIARGEAKAALAVGCEAFSRLAFVGFSRMRAMSADACRPFSRGRPGLLLGEGAAALVLETEEAARSRGAPCWGFVEGFGLSCDAFHITGPRPDAAGACRAMEDALRRAGRDASTVDWVNAHGTGTPLNDKTESLAIRRVFGERGRSVPVSSVKALTGHTMGAAGAIEAAASLLALRHGVIPPTWNWIEADPECEVDCVPNEPREAKLRVVLSNSYAFGGNNSSLVLTSPSA